LEKGLQWETTWLDLPAGEHKRPEYLAINPVGKVPALIDDALIIHDSTIIGEYLEDRYLDHPLLPADPALKARARAFEDYADAYLAPSMYKILFQMRKPEVERDHAKIEEAERETRRHFEYLNRELAGREFIAGEFSLADIAYMPHLSSYERAGYAVPSDLIDLHRWWQRLKARPSYAESWPL